MSTHPPLNTASTYVIGHRNPDTDSICSALAYAAYKHATGHRDHIAARCGNSNARIDAVLARFGQPLPVLLTDVYPRVRDLMATDLVAVGEDATCAEALELIDRHSIGVLPVVDSRRRAVGTVSLGGLGHHFVPRVAAPRAMRQVRTSIARIARALKARVLHLPDADRTEELFVRIGAMANDSFWQLSQAEGIPAAQSIIIVGDRREIQQRSVELGVRLIVISGNRPVDDAIAAAARAAGVGLLISPYDTATTAWVVRTAATLDSVIERQFTLINPDTRAAEIRARYGGSSPHALLVAGDDGSLQGILTKSDLLKPVPTRLVLVDHNELSQAVPGADEVTIAEIIDHHRLGPIATPQPILFLNEPVGSTCTIVAGLFRQAGLKPSAPLAGLMMSGLISDTLLLKSPTSTPKDADTLAWLETHTDIKAPDLAHLIFSSGSVILSSAADRVVRSDFKVYEEGKTRFAVSQVEELGFDNFWAHAPALATALSELRGAERLGFACLLVTDINTQNSLLLVKGDPALLGRITYPQVQQDEIFDLPGVVSRKKQLIPYLTSLLRE